MFYAYFLLKLLFFELIYLTKFKVAYIVKVLIKTYYCIFNTYTCA